MEVTNQVEKSAQPKSASARPAAAGDCMGAPPSRPRLLRGRRLTGKERVKADFGSESFEEESEEEDEIAEPKADRGERQEERSAPIPIEASHRKRRRRSETKVEIVVVGVVRGISNITVDFTI